MGSPNLMNMASPIEHLSFENEYLQGGKITVPKGVKKMANGVSKPVDTTASSSLQSSELQYGRRLIVHTVDHLARTEPHRIWATIPLGLEISDGFRDVTVTQLANAVNSLAWWVDGKFGRSESFEVIAYLGVPDLRYAILFFALVKCGYVVSIFFILI